jgi:hypothetical protein
MTEPLSPAAQAVLDTMRRSYDHEPTRRALAAGVLRAAADQVVPLETASDCSDQAIQRTRIRIKLLAIAAELLANNAEAPPS